MSKAVLPGIIAIDLDGTIIDKTGRYESCVLSMTKELMLNGVKAILWTSREQSRAEKEAKTLLDTDDIKFDSVNTNLPEVVKWYKDNGWGTPSNKVFAHLYYDDAAFGFNHDPIKVIRFFKEYNHKYLGISHWKETKWLTCSHCTVKCNGLHGNRNIGVIEDGLS